MTDRCAKVRKQKQCHCNSVSFSFSVFFNRDFINFIKRILFEHLCSLGTSHNLSWRGGGKGVEEKLGGLQIFLDGIWGALKCQKMTLGGLQVSFK